MTHFPINRTQQHILLPTVVYATGGYIVHAIEILHRGL